MSLDWSIAQVVNYQELNDGGIETAKTNYCVWATLCVDMPRITEKNAKEFFNRIQCWEAICNGPIYALPDTEHINADGSKIIGTNNLTLQDIIRRINLYTNVIERTRAGFLNKCKQHLEQKYFK